MAPRSANTYVYQLVNEVKQKADNRRPSHPALDVAASAQTTNDSSYSCMTNADANQG